MSGFEKKPDEDHPATEKKSPFSATFDTKFDEYNIKADESLEQDFIFERESDQKRCQGCVGSISNTLFRNILFPMTGSPQEPEISENVSNNQTTSVHMRHRRTKSTKQAEFQDLWVEDGFLCYAVFSRNVWRVKVTQIIQVIMMKLSNPEKCKMTIYYMEQENGPLAFVNLEFQNEKEMEDIFRWTKKLVKKSGKHLLVGKNKCSYYFTCAWAPELASLRAHMST